MRRHRRARAFARFRDVRVGRARCSARFSRLASLCLGFVSFSPMSAPPTWCRRSERSEWATRGYYAAVTRMRVDKLFGRSTASAASLGGSKEIEYFESPATGNASATLGACSISSGSAPANCAVPQLAVRSCSYQGTCSTVPACALGYVPSGSKGTCATRRICAPRICAPTFCCKTSDALQTKKKKKKMEMEM